MKIYFAGTPEFAAKSLSALIEQGKQQILGVFTQPDRPAGRGQKMQISAVKEIALQNNLPILQPQNLKNPQDFKGLEKPDLIIVVAYGLLLPQWFLDFPRLGCINVHASLLPRWRGAAPIQRAILAGDTETGINIMQMDLGLDTGDVLFEKRLQIGTDNAQQLTLRLQDLGAEALLEALDLLAENKLIPQKQEGEALYAHKLTKAEAKIDWQKSAAEIALAVRAYNPYPIAFTEIKGQNFRIYEAEALPDNSSAPAGTIIAQHEKGWDIATGDGILRVLQIQAPNKKALPASELRHGWNLVGEICQ